MKNFESTLLPPFTLVRTKIAVHVSSNVTASRTITDNIVDQLPLIEREDKLRKVRVHDECRNNFDSGFVAAHGYAMHDVLPLTVQVPASNDADWLECLASCQGHFLFQEVEDQLNVK